MQAPLIMYAQVYTLYSVFAIIKEIKRSKEKGENLPKHLLTFYYGHILNMLMFNISWIPVGYAHLASFLF